MVTEPSHDPQPDDSGLSVLAERPGQAEALLERITAAVERWNALGREIGAGIVSETISPSRCVELGLEADDAIDDLLAAAEAAREWLGRSTAAAAQAELERVLGRGEDPRD